MEPTFVEWTVVAWAVNPCLIFDSRTKKQSLDCVTSFPAQKEDKDMQLESKLLQQCLGMRMNYPPQARKPATLPVSRGSSSTSNHMPFLGLTDKIHTVLPTAQKLQSSPARRLPCSWSTGCVLGHMRLRVAFDLETGVVRALSLQGQFPNLQKRENDQLSFSLRSWLCWTSGTDLDLSSWVS